LRFVADQNGRKSAAVEAFMRDEATIRRRCVEITLLIQWLVV
jgi:hypothetical protein